MNNAQALLAPRPILPRVTIREHASGMGIVDADNVRAIG